MSSRGRGTIARVALRKSITFNGNTITKAIIEIDHINYGLNPKTGELNKKARTNFSTRDIEKFISLLDGELIVPKDYNGKTSKFSIRITCPVKGKFEGKEFLMFFDTHYDKHDQIHTITLYPGWKK